MKKHLYNSKVSKIIWFIKRFGLREIIMKPIRTIFADSIIKGKKGNFFMFNSKKYKLYYSKYNTTWANERCVEIPIIMELLRSHKGKKLEIGNVLSHYFKTNWDMIDKFEKGKNISNEDIYLDQNSWIEISKSEAKNSRYGKPFPYGNCIFVGSYKKS